MRLTTKETATVLAALRLWQEEITDMHGDHGARERCPEHFASTDPLTRKQIDLLCEELNVGITVGSTEVVRPGPAEFAKLFHATYESLAKKHGYKTRAASAKPWEEVPDTVRVLMTEVCQVILYKMFQEGWPEQ